MNKKKYTVTDRLITKITGWIAGITVVILGIWGIYTLWEFYEYEQTNDAQVQEYVNPVISRAGGFIVAVKFEENQQVKKGDTLLLIDNRDSDIATIARDLGYEVREQVVTAASTGAAPRA